jgi:hypothetical protein
MKKKKEYSDEMRPEYDFSKLKFVGRGIYAKRFCSGTNVVLLDREVSQAFPNDKSVIAKTGEQPKILKIQAVRRESMKTPPMKPGRSTKA